MTKAFDKIAAGLDDAIAFATGDDTKGRVATGRGRSDSLVAAMNSARGEN